MMCFTREGAEEPTRRSKRWQPQSCDTEGSELRRASQHGCEDVKVALASSQFDGEFLQTELWGKAVSFRHSANYCLITLTVRTYCRIVGHNAYNRLITLPGTTYCRSFRYDAYYCLITLPVTTYCRTYLATPNPSQHQQNIFTLFCKTFTL